MRNEKNYLLDIIYSSKLDLSDRHWHLSYRNLFSRYIWRMRNETKRHMENMVKK